MHNILTTVTKSENGEIKRIYGRMVALEDLLLALADGKIDFRSITEEKVREEIKACCKSNQDWWLRMSEKYSLGNHKNLFVKFDTREIYKQEA